MTATQGFDEADAPIEIYAGDTVIDGGIAAIPKMVLRFSRHLNCDGSWLNDRQVLLVIMVIALREERNLRLSNLPMIAAPSTLESDLAHLRKMGLVFTRRDYYPAVNGKPPRMRSQIWDIRSLNANLATIQRLWFQRQTQAASEWRLQGKGAKCPAYEFPPTFVHKISIPQPVLQDIVKGRFFPIPSRWLKVASQTYSPDEIAILKIRALPTASNPTSRDNNRLPTASITGSRGVKTVPTASKTGGHLLTTTTSSNIENKRINLDAVVFAHFAQHKRESYWPNGNDRKALHALIKCGYTPAQITTVIDDTFKRGDKPKRFTYCARIVQDYPPACPPAAMTQSMHSPLPDETSMFAAELDPFVELYADGDAITLRRRLSDMAASCESAAQKHGSTGTHWLKDALERSVGKADPLTYAAAILRSWRLHGPNTEKTQDTTKQRCLSPVTVRTDWNKSIDA